MPARTGRPRKTAGESTSSLYEGSDGRWHARVTMGMRPDGTLERRHVSRATKPELRAAVRELERGRDNGEHRWTEHDPTLGVWLEHWLTDLVPLTTRWKTQSTYTSQIRLHVLPTMSHIRLSELQPENLEHLYGYLLDNGRSIHTVRAVHRVVRSALNEAVRRRRMHSNPALVARAPRHDTDEVEPLTVGEAQRLLAAAAKRPNAARWAIALSLGLRQGEALGLMWSDLDLEDGTLRVRRSVQRWTWRHGCPLTATDAGAGVPECGRKRGAECPERTGGGIRMVETKTKGSRRTVVLPLPLVEELKAHRAAQARQRLEVGPDWDATHDLVFATKTGSLIDPCRDREAWLALLKDAGLRHVRVHDARHTAATLLLLQGVDIRTVMAIMGWTEMATAQRYLHAVDDLRRRAAQQMGSLLWDTCSTIP